MLQLAQHDSKTLYLQNQNYFWKYNPFLRDGALLSTDILLCGWLHITWRLAQSDRCARYPFPSMTCFWDHSSLFSTLNSFQGNLSSTLLNWGGPFPQQKTSSCTDRDHDPRLSPKLCLPPRVSSACKFMCSVNSDVYKVDPVSVKLTSRTHWNKMPGDEDENVPNRSFANTSLFLFSPFVVSPLTSVFFFFLHNFLLFHLSLLTKRWPEIVPTCHEKASKTKTQQFPVHWYGYFVMCHSSPENVAWWIGLFSVAFLHEKILGLSLGVCCDSFHFGISFCWCQGWRCVLPSLEACSCLLGDPLIPWGACSPKKLKYPVDPVKLSSEENEGWQECFFSLVKNISVRPRNGFDRRSVSTWSSHFSFWRPPTIRKHKGSSLFWSEKHLLMNGHRVFSNGWFSSITPLSSTD